MGSAAAKKAWKTRRARGMKKPKRLKGRRIKIHSPKVKVNGHAKSTFAPPKKWWDHMTKDPHGSAGKPLSPAAAGHLWFKVYGNEKRAEAIKQYG